MDLNTTDSGSRMTRSLRKRLTSVDSDSSSRPGTPPVPSKLTSILEITSPSRSTRLTRRNSTAGIATPVTTPAKRGVVNAVAAENAQTTTPGKRNTRRLSTSVYENEESQITKTPLLAVLDEESHEQKSTRVTRSQSKSPQIKALNEKLNPKSDKSQDNSRNKDFEADNTKTEIQKRRKVGPKSKTRQQNDESDVEINVFETEVEEIRKESKNIATIIITDDESNNANINTVESENVIDIEKPNLDKSDLKLSNDAEKNSSNMKEFQINENNETEVETKNLAVDIEKIEFDHSIDKNNSDAKVSGMEENTILSNIEQNVEEKNIEVVDEPKHLKNYQEENTADPSSIKRITNSLDTQNNTDVIQNEELECDKDHLPETEIKLLVDDSNELSNEKGINNSTDFSKPKSKQKPPSSDKIEIISVCNMIPNRVDENDDLNVSNCRASTKRVEFVASPSNDMIMKNVYPKTPAPTKISNSFIVINSSLDDENSFQDEQSINKEYNQSITLNTVDEDNVAGNKEEVEDEQLKKCSEFESNTRPVCASKGARPLEVVHSSTSIITETSTREESHVIKLEEKPFNVEKKGENSKTLTNENSAVINKNSTPDLKWIIPSVKGTTVEGSKLDTIVLEQSTSSNDTDDNNSYAGQVYQVKTDKKKSIIFLSEEEEENAEGRKDDGEDEGESELAPGEEPYKREHDFHDDEAMEIEDYMSGDSMDSEERREIEENELPIEGVSIGSQTTDDEHDEYAEEEDSENTDSFIVSDYEELECLDSNDEDEPLDEDINDHSRKKKYKRLQHPADSSSSSNEDGDKPYQKQIKLENPEEHTLESRKEKTDDKKEDDSSTIFIPESNSGDLPIIKSSENTMLDSSKLSDSALRLQCTSESESEEDEINDRDMNISRKEILRKLNQSDRFNKSVRDLNIEIDTSPIEPTAIDQSENIHEGNGKENVMISDGDYTSSTSFDKVVDKKHNSSKQKFESHLGDVSVTPESDTDKKNKENSLILPLHCKPESELSVSFGTYKKSKNKLQGRQEWQRSFTIDVTVKGGDLETVVTDVNEKDQVLPSDSSSSPGNDQENEGEDKRLIENIKHMPLPLGNPLIRTRRLSLALPTNPDMEIGSSHGFSGKKLKRKSLGILSGNDFNPSQSFVDSIELEKSELNQQVAKRKRLSKSFCGASEALDNSIIDIDVRHLHKRSKLIGDTSIVESHHDSIENISTSKLSTKLSSTPHRKTDKNYSNNNIHRILSRCDEILQDANRAKLEAKINHKKSKVEMTKKFRKNTMPPSVTNGSSPEDVLRTVTREIKRKDNTKTALSQAIKAADVILGRKKPNQVNKDEQGELESKRLPPDVLETIDNSASTKKKTKKAQIYTISTSAGTLMEMPQTPEKRKKKSKYIQLPTGKMCVEPITPKKSSVLGFNGIEFRESPITPYAVGFKVKEILPLAKGNELMSSNGKRKRRHYDETHQAHPARKSKWTQSGAFIEEDILPKNRRIARSEILTFKENALMRSDIKRCSKREILLLKERR